MWTASWRSFWRTPNTAQGEVCLFVFSIFFFCKSFMWLTLRTQMHVVLRATFLHGPSRMTIAVRRMKPHPRLHVDVKQTWFTLSLVSILSYERKIVSVPHVRWHLAHTFLFKNHAGMAFITFVADAKKAKCRFLLAFRAQVIQTVSLWNWVNWVNSEQGCNPLPSFIMRCVFVEIEGRLTLVLSGAWWWMRRLRVEMWQQCGFLSPAHTQEDLDPEH